MTATNTDDCAQWDLTLHGFLDGELDAAHSLQFEQHLATCEHCAAQLRRFQALKLMVGQKATRWRAPDHLRAQIVDTIARESTTDAARDTSAKTSRTGFSLLQFVKQWSFVPSFAALAASLFIVLAPLKESASIQDEIVASHVRSLLANHLTDVATSDQHTVKPWFNGKIDFSPPVVDLAAYGFPLVGGRVDYIGGRVVAALVYRRNGHVINIFAWPGGNSATTIPAKEGYNLVSWTEDGLNFWAVSDVATSEIVKLRDRFIEQSSK